MATVDERERIESKMGQFLESLSTACYGSGTSKRLAEERVISMHRNVLEARQAERERREELEGALEEIAEAPGEPPCGCVDDGYPYGCDCGNVGDATAAGFWRGEKAQADRARQALKGET